MKMSIPFQNIITGEIVSFVVSGSDEESIICSAVTGKYDSPCWEVFSNWVDCMLRD